MRQLALLFLMMVVITTLLYGQQNTNFLNGGISWQPGGNPPLAGTGMYSRLLNPDTDTWAFIVEDCLPASLSPFTVYNQIGIGIGQRVLKFDIGKRVIKVFVPTNAGISWTGENVGWAWSTGALVPIPVTSHWFITPAMRMIKSSVNNNSGYRVIGTVGVGYGW